MLKLDNVTKVFQTKTTEVVAAENVSLEIKKGEIFGLIGTNGAGKTTTMRMIATILQPTNGKIYWNNEDIFKNPTAMRRQIGLLFGGDTGLYDRLTARENIEYFALLNGMNQYDTKSRIDELMKFFDMSEYIDRRAGAFSRGMKQKTAFARCIVHNPALMLFDEPTAGLDILVAEEVLKFIKLMREQGKAVLLSSHDMAEVTELCDRVAIIHKGRICEQGTVLELKEKYKKDNMKEVFMNVVDYKGGALDEEF